MRRIQAWAIVLSLLAPAGALAATSALDAMAGDYRRGFQNGNVFGDHYRSVDTLRIVKLSSDAAYVEAHLEFFNGHSCDIAGVGRMEDSALVYRTDKTSEVTAGSCVFGVRIARDAVFLSDDEDHCRAYYCGARGTLEGVTFPLSSRRRVTGFARLRASDAYKAAMVEYTAKPKPVSPAAP